MVEAGLRQPERPGDVADRSGVEAAVPEQLSNCPVHLGATWIRRQGGCALLASHDVCLADAPTARRRMKGAIIGPRQTDRSVGVGAQIGLPITNPTYEDLEWRSEVQAENSRNHRFTAA